jgi:sugar lactone lactonase YvrE
MNGARPALRERNIDMDTHGTSRGLVESPRWHDGRPWVADWTAGEIRVLTEGGGSRARVRR